MKKDNEGFNFNSNKNKTYLQKFKQFKNYQ